MGGWWGIEIVSKWWSNGRKYRAKQKNVESGGHKGVNSKSWDLKCTASRTFSAHLKTETVKYWVRSVPKKGVISERNQTNLNKLHNLIRLIEEKETATEGWRIEFLMKNK